MTIAEFDGLDIEKKKALLHTCCGSTAWVNNVLEALPAEDLIDLFQIAEEKWYACHESDWREAFAQHPRIGDINSLKENLSAANAWAEKEQSAVKQASEQTIQELAAANEKYEQRFGYTFIVCATGKPANEMLQILNQRLYNSPEVEIQVAMEEQLKITRLRLEKLFGINEP
ncbi:2-oxo-4-hydroxy-4-carboxy-5-ureidoimidazoline decarboxylase [Longitalea arenae]|uniref:2-oxo-4-hydroxy-4-carboxy-5-ureidoimidazoline decarboxylase n=1 Tax=Longitalea arenae TaxID=2812558 RepID=UPI0019689123|nr:2-oxo-4-hydroxy-4-carboxy-5-ureidoimidazoline decarboxylase [Longitalea arenae]